MSVSDALNKYLIVGRSGYIANALMRDLNSKNIPFATTSSTMSSDVETCYHLDLDVADNVPVEVIKEYPSIVFLAAVSSPDYCKNEYERAYGINVRGTTAFIEKCLKAGARVLFFSSDVVYGETGDNIVDEESTVRPHGAYGKMKARVESTFAQEPGFVAVRTSYVVSMKDNFSRYMNEKIRSGERLEIFDPLVRSPIGLDDVVASVQSIFNNWRDYGAVNLCGPEHLGRLQLMEKLADNLGLIPNFEVVQPPKEFYVARPQSIRITSKYLNQILGKPPQPIESVYAEELEGDL